MSTGNVVTNYTRTALVTYLQGLSTLYLGVGIGTTTPVNADTALGTEVTTGSLGGSGTYTRPGPITGMSLQTTTVSNDTVQWGPGASTTWTNPVGSSNTPAVTEAGIFSAVSAGNMYYHTVFAAMNIAPGFGIQVQASIVAA